jgi:hypothetical protein
MCSDSHIADVIVMMRESETSEFIKQIQTVCDSQTPSGHVPKFGLIYPDFWMIDAQSISITISRKLALRVNPPFSDTPKSPRFHFVLFSFCALFLCSVGSAAVIASARRGREKSRHTCHLWRTLWIHSSELDFGRDPMQTGPGWCLKHPIFHEIWDHFPSKMGCRSQ